MQMLIGKLRQKTVEQRAKQPHISLTGKVSGIQRDFNIYAALQITLPALKPPVPHVGDARQTLLIDRAIRPTVKLQRIAQHIGVIHHPQKAAAGLAEQLPVEAVALRRISISI